MAETIFSTNECVWSQVSMSILGRKITGLRGFEIKLDIEKEHLYAGGSKPIDIQSGNEKPEGNIKVLKFEADLYNDAARAAGYATILHVPHTLIHITVEYKKSAALPIRRLFVPGAAFSSLGIAMEQNAKMTEITLPFLAMDVIFS